MLSLRHGRHAVDIQMARTGDTGMTPDQIRDRTLEAHLPYIDRVGAAGVQVLCFQDVFTQPYFCPIQNAKRYSGVEKTLGGEPVAGQTGLASFMSLEG